MKLIMTMLVRDESDILDDNIRFHLAHGVDRILIMDNLSVDGTADIAHKYVRAGYADYEFQPDDIYAQSRWVTAMARRAYDEFGASWVINSDADEFWMPRSGSLKDALAAIPEALGAAAVERSNFVPRGDNDEPFWRRMNARWAVSQNALGEPLQGKVAHRGAGDVIVAAGNHSVTIADVSPKTSPAQIDVLHFPVRSREQYVNKIVKGASALANNRDLDPEIGHVWRQLKALYSEGKFNEVWAREFLSERAIAAGLAAGTLIHDSRLASALASR